MDTHNALTKEAGMAMQFRTKSEAISAAREVPGYGPSDVTRLDVMGFYVWVLSDPHMNLLSRAWYCAWKGKKQGIMAVVNGKLAHV